VQSSQQSPASKPAPSDSSAALSSIELYHIPCPNGHEIDAPKELLDQPAVCPHCNVRFVLRKEDSRELRAEREKVEKRLAMEQERRANAAGNLWLVWVVVIGLVVLGFLALLIFLSS